IELYTGTFISKDGNSTAILVGAPSAIDRTDLYRHVLEIIAKPRPAGAVGSPPSSDDISVTGAPVAESLLGIHILEDLGVPRALLGASTRSQKEHLEWKVPRTLYEFRLLIARRIGLVPI